MKVNEMFPTKYVKGDELPSTGLKVTITAVKVEKMRKPGQAGEVDGFVLWCQGAKRGIVLSAPLARQIAKITGEGDTDNWNGKTVVLYPEPMTVAGVDRVAIRARAAVNGNH